MCLKRVKLLHAINGMANFLSVCSDIWSCGVILYILLCGIPPFFAENETAIFKQVLKGNVDFETHPWPNISTEAKDCVRKMLTRDVTKRATAAQILQVDSSHQSTANSVVTWLYA